MRHEILDSAAGLPATDWAVLDHGGDPFVSREFLAAAEGSGAAGPALGWRPRHLLLRDDAGDIAALLPLYQRDHSFGDFSRDWNWPGAWRQFGLDYYPKLVSGVPYTPSPGPRMLVRVGLARSEWQAAALDAVFSLAADCGVSSWQCLFVEEMDRAWLADAGLLLRRGVQFHWTNRGYPDFDAFLAGFTAEKRKKLKRERRAVADSGLDLGVLHGDEIDEATWRVIHRQYRATFMRHGNHPAFPLEFFVEAGRTLGRRMVIFVARDAADVVASAICYRDAHTLYGRHWGAEVGIPGLHFELCYHQGIEYCIRNGLARFEPGAQGEHKLARGFEPVPTWSAFWIADPRLRRAVADFVAREDAAMQDYAAETASHLPFKRDS